MAFMIMIQTYKKQNYFDSGNDLGDNEANVFFIFLRRCNHKLKDEKNKRKNTYTYISILNSTNQPTNTCSKQSNYTRCFYSAVHSFTNLHIETS